MSIAFLAHKLYVNFVSPDPTDATPHIGHRDSLLSSRKKLCLKYQDV